MQDRNEQKAYIESISTAFDEEQTIAETRAEMAALDPSSLSTRNVDLRNAPYIVMGAIPFLHTLADDIAKLPRFEIKWFTNLLRYTRCAWTTAIRDSPSDERKRHAAKLWAEARPLADKLTIAGRSLAADSKFDPEALKTPPRGKSTLQLANRLARLSVAYRRQWDVIEGKSIVTFADVEEAEIVAGKLFFAAALRNHPTDESRASRDDAVRAFTLMDRGYFHCRRAAIYLCWDDEDLARKLPSIRAKHMGRGASVEE